MIRILIVDDHAILRRGLIQIISEASDMEVAAEAETGAQAIKLAREQRFDVVLLDITMPDRNGFDTLKQLKKENPRLAVLILSMHPEEQYAVRALKAGAAGYLNKHSAPALLISALRQVANGHRYVSPKVAEELAGAIAHDPDRPLHELLSNREYETLRLMASGRTPSQIAADLSLSVKTVSVYRARLLEKLQLKNNAELTRYALQHQLVD